MPVDEELILSRTKLAARLRCSPSCLTVWIKRGMLHGDALTEDGQIRVAIADLQIREAGVGPYRRSRSEAAARPTKPTPPRSFTIREDELPGLAARLRLDRSQVAGLNRFFADLLGRKGGDRWIRSARL